MRTFVAVHYRYSVKCENGHDYVSIPDRPEKIARHVTDFLEDGCRCHGVFGGVYRYGVDRKGRRGPEEQIHFDLIELPGCHGGFPCGSLSSGGQCECENV